MTNGHKLLFPASAGMTKSKKQDLTPMLFLSSNRKSGGLGRNKLYY
jgi:hypothetical protein